MMLNKYSIPYIFLAAARAAGGNMETCFANFSARRAGATLGLRFREEQRDESGWLKFDGKARITHVRYLAK
jgi:hypothetical protein